MPAWSRTPGSKGCTISQCDSGADYAPQACVARAVRLSQRQARPVVCACVAKRIKKFPASLCRRAITFGLSRNCTFRRARAGSRSRSGRRPRYARSRFSSPSFGTPLSLGTTGRLIADVRTAATTVTSLRWRVPSCDRQTQTCRINRRTAASSPPREGPRSALSAYGLSFWEGQVWCHRRLEQQ